MTCQYHNDFFDVGGFEDYLLMTESTSAADGTSSINETDRTKFPSTWGGEDVLLYRKHLQSNRLNVIRSIDPGIFHLWHQKTCEKNKFQTSEQLHSCLSTKALNEASQTQLANALAEFERHNLP